MFVEIDCNDLSLITALKLRLEVNIRSCGQQFKAGEGTGWLLVSKSLKFPLISPRVASLDDFPPSKIYSNNQLLEVMIYETV